MYRKPYLSYTKIKTYLTCKQKYKFKYVDKIPTSEDSNSKHLSFGTSIHMALADYNRIKDEEFKTLPILQNLLRKNWKREGYQSREEEREFGLRGLALLEDYYGDPKDDGVDNYIIEEMVYLELEDFILCGKLDKVYKRPDDIVEILDYKTSKTMENVEFLQLPIYLILAKSKLGFYPEALSLYYLTFNEKVIQEVDSEAFEQAKVTLYVEEPVPLDEETSKSQFPESDVPPQNQCIIELKIALDYLEVIHKTVRILETENRTLSNRLTTIENLLIEDNPIQKVSNLADDMIKIYASENSKKNVNINPVINDRVIELMKSKFNIQNNNAQAINTALLIALYKSKIGDKKDEK